MAIKPFVSLGHSDSVRGLRGDACAYPQVTLWDEVRASRRRAHSDIRSRIRNLQRLLLPVIEVEEIPATEINAVFPCVK